MARITVEDCIDKFPSRFELVLVASQRARKLHSGDSPTVEKDNDKNTVIALREIADSSLTVEQMKENLIQEYQTVTISDEEDENLELDNLDEQNNILEENNLKASTDIVGHKNDAESEVKKNDDNISASDEIDAEMKDLISAEDHEIEENFEITNNSDEQNLIVEDDADISKSDQEKSE